ncbi:hypothetical protein D039_0555A, partial [Vibrio parahaemolyticus EKP-028]
MITSKSHVECSAPYLASLGYCLHESKYPPLY